jgi:hypothetical protein
MCANAGRCLAGRLLPSVRIAARQADTFEQRFVDRPKAADRLSQSAFDLFASPARTVFLSDPLRQHGGTSLHVGVVADRPDLPTQVGRE